MMERERQWSGLLIEQDPTTYEKLVEKRRKAVLLNACVKVYILMCLISSLSYQVHVKDEQFIGTDDQ